MQSGEPTYHTLQPMQKPQFTSDQEVQSSVPIVHFNNMSSYEAPVKPIEQTSYSVNGQPTYNSAQFPLANQRGSYGLQSQDNHSLNKVYYVHERQNGIDNYFSQNKVNVYNHDIKNACSDQYSSMHSHLNYPNVKSSYPPNYSFDHYQQPNRYFQTKDQPIYYQTAVNGTTNYSIQASSLNQHPSTFRSMHGNFIMLQLCL